jgi:hypothetical protein
MALVCYTGRQMSKLLNSTALVVLLFLVGCSTQQYSSPADAKLKLLPPADVTVPVLLKQKVILQSGGGQQQFLVVARFEPDRLKLVVLSPIGQQLLMLDYDGEVLVEESFSSIDLPGREILAVIQFALWPAPSIKGNYPEKEGWFLEIGTDKRILQSASRMHLEISYDDGKFIIQNYVHEYRVIVYLLEKTEL